MQERTWGKPYNFWQTNRSSDKIENMQFQIGFNPQELYELYLKFTPRLDYEQDL